LSQEQQQREQNYRVSMALAIEMHKQDIINKEELSVLKQTFIRKFNPPIGSLETA